MGWVCHRCDPARPAGDDPPAAADAPGVAPRARAARGTPEGRRAPPGVTSCPAEAGRRTAVQLPEPVELTRKRVGRARAAGDQAVTTKGRNKWK
jgi:hypothetical protein